MAEAEVASQAAYSAAQTAAVVAGRTAWSMVAGSCCIVGLEAERSTAVVEVERLDRMRLGCRLLVVVVEDKHWFVVLRSHHWSEWVAGKTGR